MIAVSSETFDTLGFLLLNISTGSKLSALTRRVTKTATLDGGSTLIDLGHAPSDADYVITVDIISLANLEKLKRLVRLYPRVNLATTEGFFSGVITSFNSDQVPLTFTFSVREKLSD